MGNISGGRQCVPAVAAGHNCSYAAELHSFLVLTLVPFLCHQLCSGPNLRGSFERQMVRSSCAGVCQAGKESELPPSFIFHPFSWSIPLFPAPAAANFLHSQPRDVNKAAPAVVVADTQGFDPSQSKHTGRICQQTCDLV